MEQFDFTSVHPKEACEMVNNVELDQTAQTCPSIKKFYGNILSIATY